jgi:hypothetical protein
MSERWQFDTSVIGGVGMLVAGCPTFRAFRKVGLHDSLSHRILTPSRSTTV